MVINQVWISKKKKKVKTVEKKEVMIKSFCWNRNKEICEKRESEKKGGNGRQKNAKRWRQEEEQKSKWSFIDRRSPLKRTHIHADPPQLPSSVHIEIISGEINHISIGW